MGSFQPENDAKQELNDSGCVQDDSMGEKYIGQAELLDLSDDVLLYILKHCTPRDLKALGHTCPRLGTLICDRTLWQRVDARSSPTGQERLHWLLTHCLTQGTQELKLTGYVDKHNKCLGIQDPVWPAENGGSSYPDTDFILRMWYSHLPRHATSPRWPDKREAAGRAYSRPTESVAMPLSPLTQLASQIVAGTSSGPSCTITDLINSERKPGDFVPRSNHTGTTASNSGTGTNQSGPSSSCSRPNSSNSGANSSNSGANSSNSGANSSNSGADSSNSGPDSSESGFTSGEASSKDDVSSEKCHGPRFTLNHSLLKSLKSKCRNLTSLTLEYCNLDFKNANLRHFPPRLRKLSLKGTRCYNLPLGTSYLGKIQDRLPDLEVLDISECDWFDPASLLPLSKVKNLQELYMRDCRKMAECVAYASLATRYGFQKLRILDLRGSPVGDSEVSALGWLPLLEELYLSPPDEFVKSTEHSHKWDDVLVPFNELDAWETEEPDYYKCKSPTADCMDEVEEPKEEREDVPDGRYRENTFGSYISRSLEQRIIVIHPNRRDWEHELPMDYAVNPFPLQARPPANPPPANPPPANPPPANPQPANPQPANPQPADNTDHGPSVDPAPGTSRRPLKRQNPDRVLDLVKRRFEKHIGISLDIEEEPVDEPLQTIEESNENSNAQESSPKKPRSDSPKPSTSKTDSAEPSTSKSPTQNDDKTPKNPGQPGPQAPNAGGRSFRIGSAEFLLREVPNRADDGILGRSYLARYCERISGLMEGNPPLAVHARPVRNRPNVEGNRPINAVICGLPEPFGPRRHRAPLLSIGHHLVTDSAVLRFGRADNNNINYVYIGHNFHANDPGVRPDRSNLRILSMTGYTYITDRSLEHLATAAPNIRHIDFSFSGITDRGVEFFKAIRPNCEVIFNGKF